MHDEQRSNQLTSQRIKFQLGSWGHFLMIKIAKPWNMLTMKTSISEAFQQVKQTLFENDIGTVDLPHSKEMDCMTLQGPLQPQLPMTA